MNSLREMDFGTYVECKREQWYCDVVQTYIGRIGVELMKGNIDAARENLEAAIRTLQSPPKRLATYDWLSLRTANALFNTLGIRTMEQLNNVTEDQLHTGANLGPMRLIEIRNAIEKWEQQK